MYKIKSIKISSVWGEQEYVPITYYALSLLPWVMGKGITKAGDLYLTSNGYVAVLFPEPIYIDHSIVIG